LLSALLPHIVAVLEKPDDDWTDVEIDNVFILIKEILRKYPASQ
jgi:hypothetical protein